MGVDLSLSSRVTLETVHALQAVTEAAEGNIKWGSKLE